MAVSMARRELEKLAGCMALLLYSTTRNCQCIWSSLL
jgi:hypothetical protein